MSLLLPPDDFFLGLTIGVSLTAALAYYLTLPPKGQKRNYGKPTLQARKDSLYIFVEFTTENDAEFRKHYDPLQKGSLQEPGNLRYDLLRHVDKQTRKVVDPSKYYMVEQFENLEAYKAHNNSKHFKAHVSDMAKACSSIEVKHLCFPGAIV
mmetsp:Transcript_13272/g.30206  ORF Transcript_13272/g.30206 Transcript_13272/m.30206 type:complete len:152 (-) Transcript_13272:113-568(-)